MKYFDLFCGIGGFHKALEKHGQWVGACDNNAIARNAYQILHDKCVEYGNVREIVDFPDFDILCAGFPCQPFSRSGKRQGFDDATSGDLFFEIVRILELKKPEIVFLENVKGLTTQSFDGVKKEMCLRLFAIC